MNRLLKRASIVVSILCCGQIGPFVEVAKACSCVELITVAPEGIGVPMNTKIWLNTATSFPLDPNTYHLLAPEAEVDVTAAIFGGLVVLKPLENLAPMTVYQAFHCAAGQESFADILGCDKVLEFTTGDHVIEGVPEVPKVIDREAHYIRAGKDKSSCGSEHAQSSVSVTYQTPGEVMLFDFGTSHFDPQALTGTIDRVASTENSMFRAFYGNTACTIAAPERDQHQLTVRVGTLDLAGHFSGWSEPDTIVMPNGVCSASATQDRSLWLFAGALGLLTWRRRSKKKLGMLA